MKLCHSGEFNVDYEGDELYVYIYLRGKQIIKIRCYKNPWQIAVSVLGAPNPYEVVNIINDFRSRGLIEGKDFTITEKGVYEIVKFPTIPEVFND